MDEENNNDQWVLLGRWEDPVITSLIWLNFDNPEIDFDMISKMKLLKYNNLFLKKDIQKIKNFFEEKIKNDMEWFNRFFSECENRLNKMVSYKNKDDFENFINSSKKALGIVYDCCLLDFVIEDYLKNLCKKHNLNINNVISRIVPYRKTFIMKYQEDLKELSEDNISKFVNKYKSIGTTMFYDEPLTEEKVRHELKDISKTNNSNKVEADEINIPHDFDNIINLGSKLTYYKTYIVEMFNDIAYNYRTLLDTLAKEHNLDYNDLLNFTCDEIIDLFKNGNISRYYKERKNGFGFIWDNGKITEVFKEDLNNHLKQSYKQIDNENIKKFKGIVAYKSKSKIIGNVKVIESKKYINKLNKGEILVTSETTPDYITGIRIAGAIITNQGGITSHASIISRELQIPCIIGTKIATHVLKDGDLVEVNANQGIVKILEKAK